MDEDRQICVGDKDRIELDFVEAEVGEYVVEIRVKDPNDYIKVRTISYEVVPKIEEVEEDGLV